MTGKSWTGVRLSVTNVFVRMATRPQIERMIARPTMPQRILLRISALPSPFAMMKRTILTIMYMTAKEMRTPITVLPMLVILATSELASVIGCAANATEGAKTATAAINFFMLDYVFYKYW